MHHTNSNTGGVSKICQIYNFEHIAIAAEISKQLVDKIHEILFNFLHNRRYFFKFIDNFLILMNTYLFMYK